MTEQYIAKCNKSKVIKKDTNMQVYEEIHIFYGNIHRGPIYSCFMRILTFIFKLQKKEPSCMISMM